ncbi:uncharacterized protein LOC101722544 isoform X1 [Heterocephalus glaber]|uniref:Uncharacterized protein LOC101722544 isoform X1 n=1 Tax=Heterocephalus glaber TaxID=10181 RepID=A0AAX6QX18_HETGA|nr:uncharacterized protein LOC101722544 isoform X1 [Heterocephalus glaber]
MQGAGPLRSPRKTGLLRVCEQVRPAQHRGQAGSSGCFTHSCRAGGHQGTAEPTHHRVPEPGQSFLSVVKIHLPRARASPPVGSCPSAQHGGLQPAPPRCKGTWRLRCWRPKVAGTEPGLPLPPLARRPPGSQASLGLFSAILQSTKGQGPGSASRAPWGHPLSCSRQVREPRHRAELPQMPATPWMWRMQWGRYLDPQRPRSAGAEWALPRARPAPRIWHGQKAPWPWSREGDGTRSAICALRTGRAQIPFTEENWCSSGRLLLLPRRPRVAGSRDSPCGGTAEPGPRAVRVGEARGQWCPWQNSLPQQHCGEGQLGFLGGQGRVLGQGLGLLFQTSQGPAARQTLGPGGRHPPLPRGRTPANKGPGHWRDSSSAAPSPEGSASAAGRKGGAGRCAPRGASPGPHRALLLSSAALPGLQVQPLPSLPPPKTGQSA